MKKSISTIILIVFAFFNINAQSLKTYSGSYTIKSSTFGSGNATYTYYINGGNETKKGNFSFDVKSTNNAGSMSIKITGKYDDDLKTGLWTYTLDVVSRQTGKMTMTLKANYITGLPNGLWQFSMVGGNNTVTSNVSATFDKGIVIGDFIYKAKDNTKSVEYTAKLDNKGYILSSFRKQNQNSTSEEYYKGVLLNNDYTKEQIDEIINFHEKYSSNLDSLKDYKYVIEENEQILPETTYDYFFNFMYLFDDIQGDVNYVSTDYRNNVEYKYGGFKYREIKTQKTSTDYYNEKINSADQAFYEQKFKKAIEYYNDAIQIKKADYASNRIVECNNKIAEIEEQKENEYKKNISEGNNYFKDYKFRESKQSYEKALQIKQYDKYASSRVKLINDFERDPDKYNKIGSEFSGKNQLDSAIHYYSIIYYYFPKNPSVINSLGWHLILNKQFDEALKIFENGVSITQKSDNSYPFLLGNLAHCYLFTNNFEKASNIYYNNTDLTINQMPWADAVVTDFNQFIDLGFKNEHYLEIAKKLKKKKLLKIDK